MSLQVVYFGSNLPDVCRVVATLAKVDVTFVASKETVSHQPYLDGNTAAGSISGDVNIARYFSRVGAPQVYGADAWESSQIDQWLEYFSVLRENMQVAGSYPVLNSHLASRTFMVGQTVSLADFAFALLLKRAGFSQAKEFVHIARWFSLAVSLVPAPKALAPKAPKQPVANDAKSVKKEVEEGETGSCPHLENAEDGKVCTRFPPEPSGYLHIGHAKAVLLNQYYAQRYHGRMLIRFDDTNPSKEKDEFEENIIKDLETLNVHADSVSHTSDHFATCEEFARKMIREGNAYMDDTDQEKMQAERLERKNSYRRDTSPEENLAIFERLLKGEPDAQSFCLRAKIDMSSVNGTMRDPVMYRFNDTPHHRTGTQFKAYPTYDFACPIVDSIEGVTHALRTTEYNDRDEQYHWIQKALGLRNVYIQTFGKMNFVNTVLSKRKLTWFVENNLVESWFDPRFPTIQGCVRRGMNIEALKQFIISQGASRRVITMEWDKFWAENKKVLEDIAPRYMAVNVVDKVVIHLENVGDEVTEHMVPIHPLKPEMGQRVLKRAKDIYVDQEDAHLLAVGVDATILRWGNIKPSRIVVDESNPKIIKEVFATYDPEATNFSKTKKLTWISVVPDLVSCHIFEFDHLISKAKLGEDENFQDFINPCSKKDYVALGDPCLKTAKVGDIVQLERKGFFRVDEAFEGEGKSVVLFAIPDGKQKTASK